MEKFNYWHDKDMGVYEKGDNPHFDKIVDDITNHMIDKFFKNKSEDKDVYTRANTSKENK